MVFRYLKANIGAIHQILFLFEVWFAPSLRDNEKHILKSLNIIFKQVRFTTQCIVTQITDSDFYRNVACSIIL